MRLVTSIMSLREMSDDDIQKAMRILLDRFNNKFKIYRYNVGKYFEVDIDLFEVNFSKENIYDDINQLISVYEEILEIMPYQIDIIAANDDTNTEILRYEKNIDDIADFGLFVSQRTIHNVQPYYSSKICNAYLNFTHVSFGVIF